MKAPDTVSILEVPVHRVTCAQAVRWIGQLIDHVRQNQAQGVKWCLTPNPEMMEAAVTDPVLHQALQQSALNVPDGIGLIWASRILGCPLPERVAGVDLCIKLLDQAEQRGDRVFFLGARPRVVEQAVSRCLDRWSGLTVAGWHHGYFEQDDVPQLLDQLRSAQPDLLVMGMGVPREQHWLIRYQSSIYPCVALAVGGTLDILAGESQRAPEWVQNWSLEWLYRLVQEPSRWRRQQMLPRFVWRVLRQIW